MRIKLNHRLGRLSLALLLLPALAAAVALPRPSLVPGGVAVIPLRVVSPQPPRAYYDGRFVMVLRHRGE